MTENTYTVTGMTCGHCASSVSEEIGAISGVRDVSVDLATGKVTVVSESDLNVADVRAAVEEAGYALA
ncbi:heavy-metal-associated domain-containing protein [Thermocrispum municipale]|jgi:copper chaperone CopZ|uniref:heavy-metal-associated domain-containing protein n=1 Tax=Thermocrispum municipale TaxID=37926 RepID=UPI0004271C32|nr:heavy metal-associated domain-containing protein [Thermocrispum municipale]